jgi:hypothetical protein
MSIPIPICLFIKAAKDDNALDTLTKRLQYNFKHGGFTALPCTHEPKCKPLTESEEFVLMKKLNKNFSEED